MSYVFCKLNEQEFSNFLKGREDNNWMQTVGVAKLRNSYGSEIEYLGVKDGKKIVCASMFTITKTFMGKKTYYAPRGFLIDYNNLELLKFYTTELKKYTKKHNGLMIKIDPVVVYQMRDIDGKEKDGVVPNDKVINDLKKLGYKHFGFNTDIVNTQSRWNFILDLDVPYEELTNRFVKSTRKNILETYDKGVCVRVGKEKDLDSIEDILVKTAERKNFNARSLEYYKRMYKYLGDDMVIYIAYLDKKKYLEQSENRLKEAKKSLEEVKEKMTHDMIGNKLKKQEEIATNRIKKCEEELASAKEFAKTIKDYKDIGVLISVKSGKEYITLYSGYLTEYARFTPKYATYNEHIKDAYRFKIPYVNFYGISGIFDPKDENYGMYEFKRGFGGEVQELIGEFTYPVSNLYSVYMLFRKIKRKLSGRG